VDGVVTYETLLEVDNSDLSLRPGMTATANITVKEVADALLVPNAALRFVPPARSNGKNEARSGGSVLTRLFPRPRSGSQNRKEVSDLGAKKNQQVWTVRQGSLTPIPVTIGASNGTFTEIVSGDLRPGLELVVDSVASRP
jgi:HlyD family secretion protein